MNKAELVNFVAKNSDLTKAKAELAVKTTVDAITEELQNGGSVTLIGFGTFSINARKERTCKNPQTGQPMVVPAKKVAKFKPGKALADVVNK